MMCEHDKLLQIMTNAVNKGENWTIRVAEHMNNLEQQLAAANARIAELEKSNKKWSIVVDDLKQLSETDKQCAEQAEAQAAAMRLRFEKYVRDNCKLIRHSVADGLGYPDDVEGKCGGYCQNYDEPHYVCQECVAAYDPENDYNEGIIDAGSALLDRMERMRGALEALIGLCENGADFRNGNVCQGIDEGTVMADRVIEEALAVLDGRDGKPVDEEGKE